jgi:hypothetical protein
VIEFASFTETIPLLLLASFVLFVAHVTRAARAALLFPANYLANRFNVLLALAIGYAVNAVLPWRLGEAVRAWFVSSRDHVRFPFSAAVIVAERLSDIVVVMPVALGLAMAGSGVSWTFPLALGGAALALLLFAVGIRRAQRLRRVIWWLGSIFNDRIRFGVADFCWSLSELVTSRALLTRRYMIATTGMWALYLASYLLYSAATATSIQEAVALLFGAPLRAAVTTVGSSGSDTGSLLLFMILPVMTVILYGIFKQGPLFIRFLEKRRRLGLSLGSLRGAARDRFTGSSEYELFLLSLFGEGNRAVSGFGLEALDDGVVHRLFPGGSDAITALVAVDGLLLIRKFAAGDAGRKLEVQADWLERHRSDGLPLVDILRKRSSSDHYLYDMPLVVPATDFYDVIHTAPVAKSKAALAQVAASIHTFHVSTAAPPANEAIISRYLNGKAADNARAILSFAKASLPSDEYSINGQRFSLTAWERLLDPDWLMAQVKDRSVATVHGDLTIENIIIAPDRDPGWYIIDPNPDNLFNSPLIDWAKLMQSLNLGYEGMNRNVGCSLKDSEILLPVTKSAAYTELHAQLEGLITQYRGPGALREVYFHELINFLRLTPYKIRQNAHKGVCFFACTSLLLHRYLERGQ